MAEQSSNARAMLTVGLSGAPIEATARRTGLVQRPSNSPGRLLLALITCGRWRDAKTRVAPWAAQATPLGTSVAVSPEALSQRMHQRALAFLQTMLCAALAKRYACAPVWAERLLTPCARVPVADRTGVGRPDRLSDPCPGAGGRAAPAGATLPRVWASTQRVVTHVARAPWHRPDQP